jgi:arylsulfatase A-like enzyme
LLEPVVQVPLVLRQAGPDRGTRIATPVETVDLMPTVVELLGLEEPEGLAGRSMAALLSGGSLRRRPFRLIERRSYPNRPEVRGLALHGGDWKVVYYHDLDGSEQRLLGRRATGLDGENRFTSDSEEAQWLESALAALDAARDGTSEDLDAEERRMLRSLGYLD